MKVARWGNSLAVRLPRSVVDQLGLQAGGEIELVAAVEGSRGVVCDGRRREELIARMRALSRPLPPDYTFDRDEANGR